jgi:DNA-binding XRE family transcriptional regulator
MADHKIAGLREAISYAKGAFAQARITRYRVPDSTNVKRLRERLGMSQPELALRFGFNHRDTCIKEACYATMTGVANDYSTSSAIQMPASKR